MIEKDKPSIIMDFKVMVSNLAKGPSPTSRRFHAYYVKGYRFHTKSHDDRCKTQNSVVSLTALTPSFASSRDKNPVLGNVDYYGRVLEIIELDYWSKFKVVLFRCEWYQVEKDELGLSCVNFNKLCCSDDPFVMPSQVHQVFYVPDPIQDGLHYVVTRVPRDLFDFEDESSENSEFYEIIDLTIVKVSMLFCFAAEWYQVEKDELGLSCVNFNKLCCSDDPFVMPSQVHQVFYVPDPIQDGLHYVVTRVPRDLFDFEDESSENIALYRRWETLTERRRKTDYDDTLWDWMSVMGKKCNQDQSAPTHMTDYERSKLLRVQENQERLRELGIKKIANSLTSLVDSRKTKKTKKNPTTNSERDATHFHEEVSGSVGVAKTQHRPQFIVPLPMNKYANLAKQRIVAPNVSRILPFEEGCERHETLVDSNAAKKSRLQKSEEANERNRLVDTTISTTKKRGPTMMHNIHTREFDRREAIICNEFKQPIGPSTKENDVVGKFSRFLGTIARTYSYCPLTYSSWHKVPDKDRMWEYVLEKYIVPGEAKSHVLQSIGALWRGHKSRLKKKHFYGFKDNSTRLKNRPKCIPEKDFLQLLRLWNSKQDQKCCLIAKKRRMSQKNMHTAGPKSFARIREDMKNEDPNKEPPSLTKMFERTRERKEGHVYADTYDETERLIEQMKNYNAAKEGEVVKMENVNGSETSYMVPGELMESVRTVIDVELNRLVEMRKQIEDDHERKKLEILEEHKRNKAELEDMSKKIEYQRDKLVEDEEQMKNYNAAKEGGSGEDRGELMESVRTDIYAELNRLVEIRKQIEDDLEQKKLEIAKEHKRNKAEPEDMIKKIEDQRDKLIEDAVKKLIQKLPPRVEQMKNYNAAKEGGSGEDGGASVDPFLAVMNK
ncbi:transposase, Ptta/En/Spm [Tanacetum coccineum]